MMKVYEFLLRCIRVTDEPGPPGRPEATDWDRDHIDLRWTPPLKDGGSPITGYIVEKREKDSPRWIKALETGPECKGRVDNLDEGVEYEFRVKAINAAGPGEPSDTSKPITAKCRRRKYISHHYIHPGESSGTSQRYFFPNSPTENRQKDLARHHSTRERRIPLRCEDHR